jgi:3D-(3,5/4)-trihydroxycyclohexane-1,2-dione acylhydrolase (decyclizing)
MGNLIRPSRSELIRQREKHAAQFSGGKLPEVLDLSLSEAIVLGLLKQNVRTIFTVFGHGSTEIGEVLRIYQQAGLVKVLGVRSEIEASHAASALRWVTGEKAAVVTSIGPGALQAMAASLVPASNGIGVWYLLGDETTEDEGFNMQQIPKHQQSLFLQMASLMGNAYSLHTPQAISTALSRGAVAVDHPSRPGPFFMLLPMNTQASWLSAFKLRELPEPVNQQLPAAEGEYDRAVEWVNCARKIVVKVGGGARKSSAQVQELLKKTGAVLVHTPIATGTIPYSHPQNMGVGGSKGSMCGNFAMENADLLIAVGTRAVCQSDCSRTGYPNVKHVININADIQDALHYADTLALVGDIGKTLAKLNNLLDKKAINRSGWLKDCSDVKARWQHFKQLRRLTPWLHDDYWGRKVLTQPAAIMIADTWAKKNAFKVFFDAGDVQANGFQVVEDDLPDQTFTESGASYMGFAVSALLATAASTHGFSALAITGDGSFTMNPQILIDGVEHKARGCILLMDNGRMGAITGLQKDQFGQEFATWNTLKVEYLSWARSVPGVLALDGGDTPDSLQSALDQASVHDGLTFIHLPVYFGDDPLGGMGVYGRWNVGNWSEEVQTLRHQIGL